MFWKRRPENISPHVVARLETIERLVQKLADELADLQDKHTRLRGKVYAHKMHKPDVEETPRPVDQLTRDELRRSLTLSGRIMPGRPVKHD